MRRSLRRQLSEGALAPGAQVPDQVRGEAVHLWRQRYMRDASKAARQRMGYRRIKGKPSYREIERECLRRYLRLHRSSTVARDVESMTVAEACEAFRASKPKPGSTSLDVFMRECVSAACAKRPYASIVGQQVVDQLVAMALSQDLSACATVSVEDATHPGRWHRRPFGLDAATSEREVLQLVRSSGLVQGMLLSAYEGQCRACRLIAHEVQRDEVVQVVDRLMSQLFGMSDPSVPVIERLVRNEAKGLDAYLQSDELAERIAGALLHNPLYRRQYDLAVELRLRVRQSVPDTPMEAYPLARTMRRHIVLHVGPTNSGKTHDALMRLMAAESGAYLGPLRLLAFEQYERLNREGVPCSLLTGEELVEIAGARHVSSTVEMADFHHPIEVAVVDEAQMVADPDRGHHWTAAVLGIPAREVHVCCAPQAEHVIRKLVACCDDECEVRYHERLVPLRPDRRRCRMPQDVRPGDALIVFSRKMVHRVASDVVAQGLRASMIYGALPHDVRHEEARRFDAGETDVVVATDAIGMGMNLPIRRIVFVEQEKYDGRLVRMLRAEEVQQIAGRAGRFGRYDEGLFTSTRYRSELVGLYRQEVPSIKTIPVGIPDNIALVQGATLQGCIRQWMTLEQPEPFTRIDVSRTLGLIAELETGLDGRERLDIDVKLKVLALATMPFDERERRLKDAWRRMAAGVLRGSKVLLPMPERVNELSGLAQLEADYHYCDLLYSYERSYGNQERMEQLMGLRAQISAAIMAILARGNHRNSREESHEESEAEVWRDDARSHGGAGE